MRINNIKILITFFLTAILTTACTSTKDIKYEVIEKEKIVLKTEYKSCFFDDKSFLIDDKLLNESNDDYLQSNKDFYISLYKIINDLQVKLKLIKKTDCIKINKKGEINDNDSNNK